MTSASQRTLPTLDNLGANVPQSLDIKGIATAWFRAFSSQLEAKNGSLVTNVLLEQAFWRDTLALTWDFRTFEGKQLIRKALQDLLPNAALSNFQLKDETITLQSPYPDLTWIQGMFAFETAVGVGSGIFRIVPTTTEEWKGYTIYTNLEELKNFPERTGPNRDFVPNHGMWPEKRKMETAFKDRDPTVVVIGGGHSGLDIAARLKLLGVPVLIVEKNAKVGDNWRGRYEALCLHDPVWYDHMPYIPFPSSWPVWTPAPKLADWLEAYAKSMELDIWLSSEVEKLEKIPDDKGWKVTIKTCDGSSRTLRPGHVIFATGFGGGFPNMPTFNGMDQFQGKMIHSTKFKSAREHIGKKVVIIGACTSAHDLAYDHYQHGVDVTIIQRGSTYVMSTRQGSPIQFGGLFWEDGPPTDVADRISASMPTKVLRLLHKRVTKTIAEADKELLEGLKARGFKLNFGPDDSGLVLAAYERGGGYYLDVGASQLIIDGKIKLKNDSGVSHFTKTSIIFENGSELPADVIIFATGLGNPLDLVTQLAGKAVTANLNPVWGLDDEGEINSVWRRTEVQGLYHMMGNLALARFYSKHLALLIKAQEEGICRERYTG